MTRFQTITPEHFSFYFTGHRISEDEYEKGVAGALHCFPLEYHSICKIQEKLFITRQTCIGWSHATEYMCLYCILFPAQGIKLYEN